MADEIICEAAGTQQNCHRVTNFELVRELPLEDRDSQARLHRWLEGENAIIRESISRSGVRQA